MSLRLSTLVAIISALLMPLSFAFADSPSVAIQSISPGTTVPVGTGVYFTAAPSGFAASVTYSISDSVSGSSIANATINGSGVFAWIPNNADAGAHTITITATDGISSASGAAQLLVMGTPAVAIKSLSPSSGSVNPGSAVTFTVSATSFVGTVTYTVSDTFNNSSIVQSNINSSGSFSWTPTSNDAGSHTINIHVTDTSGNSANATQAITVLGAGSLSIASLNPGAVT